MSVRHLFEGCTHAVMQMTNSQLHSARILRKTSDMDDKPHMHRRAGHWTCQRQGWLESSAKGVGGTPHEAYQDWIRQLTTGRGERLRTPI